MSIHPPIEGLLAAALRSEAEVAMSTTDTERQLERLGDRLEHEASRRTRLVTITVAACAVALTVVAGATLGGRDSAGPPADDRDRPTPTLSLDDVVGPEVPVNTRPVSDRAAPVVLEGLESRKHGIARDPDGTAWLLTSEPSGLEWSLLRLSADRSRVEVSVRFAGQGVPSGTATDEVVVLAVTDGAPLPDTAAFTDRRDGLLRVEKSTGKVLGFTPVAQAAGVDAAPDGTVWAVAAPDRAIQIDPRTGRTLRTVRPPGLVDQVWVLDDLVWLYYQVGEPSLAYLMDPDTGEVVRTVSNGARSIHVRLAGGMVLVQEDGRVVRVEEDGRTRAVRLQLPASGRPRDLAGYDEEDMWLSVGDSVVRIDGRTLAYEGGARLPWFGPHRVAHDGDALLVPNTADGTLRRVPDSALRPE